MRRLGAGCGVGAMSIDGLGCAGLLFGYDWSLSSEFSIPVSPRSSPLPFRRNHPFGDQAKPSAAICFGLRSVFTALFCLAAVPVAHAAADGPDNWDVVNVRSPDVLNVHVAASARSKVIASIPADARGLRNLGCTGAPSFAQWLEMTPAERARSGRARWCRISYAGSEGWVAGRFLREASQDLVFGAWTVVCRDRPCVIEQTGLAGKRQTKLRIEPAAADNATITLFNKRLPRQGVLSIHMDGKLVSSGPIAPLRSADGGHLKMTPDDITAGLLRNMRQHKTMVLSFPGETAGVEFHLEHLDEALKSAVDRAR